jgi:hypothetical protein
LAFLEEAPVTKMNAAVYSISILGLVPNQA